MAAAIILGTGLAHAEELKTAVVVPASLTNALAAQRLHAPSSEPKLTEALLQAYVARQQALKSFKHFDVQPRQELTEAVLMSYIARTRNAALDAIEAADAGSKPALDEAMLAQYVSAKFVPTEKKVKMADDERLCLTQAIYHEARGESEDGQWAVANIIINRALNKKYPSTICGVVFQNADKGKYRCQFTFACDGRSDMGTERRAWQRSMEIAEAAFAEFQRGDRPDVLPKSALFYHTTAVAPSWSRTFRRVAAIGSHVFYAPL